MKTFLEKYGLIVVSAIVTMLFVAVANPIGNAMANSSAKFVTTMTEHSNGFGMNYISYGTPAAPMTEEEFLDFLAEAERHLGKEYVFGTSGPDTFDCSGYVSWVINKSGFGEIDRTTASGLTAHCTYVSEDEAEPGDLIFFVNTYQPGISHVGIYLGEDVSTGERMMIHCGSPIQKETIDSEYWQKHFQCFGRLNEDIKCK